MNPFLFLGILLLLFAASAVTEPAAEESAPAPAALPVSATTQVAAAADSLPAPAPVFAAE